MSKINKNGLVVSHSDLETGAIPCNSVRELLEPELEETVLVFNKGVKEEMDYKEKEFEEMSEVGAYWVDETEEIKTSTPTIQTYTLKAHKIGTIVPISQEALDFGSIDEYVLANPDSKLATAIKLGFARKINEETINGTNNIFRTSLSKSAEASNQVVEGGITYDNVLAIYDLVAEEGEVTDFVFSRGDYTKVIRLVDDAKLPVFERETSSILGVDVSFVKAKTLATGLAFAMDSKWVRYGFPKMNEFKPRFKILDQGTIPLDNADGSKVNLGTQDMQALRATMYIAFNVFKDSSVAMIKPAEDTGGLGE